jgi:hypothetical protein
VSPSGAASEKPWWAINAAILLMSAFAFISAVTSCGTNASALSPTPAPAKDNKIIEVLLFDENNSSPILKDATILVDGTTQLDDDDDGGYYLQTCITGQSIFVSAPGYETHRQACTTGLPNYLIYLKPLTYNLNVNYSWSSANICSECHSGTVDHNEFQEWNLDGHSKVLTDPFFWTMYMGTDSMGRSSSDTNSDVTDSGHKVRIREDPLFGPGFLLDRPNDQGTCAYCHLPALLIQGSDRVGNIQTTLNARGGPHNPQTEGITCDICHKVTDVELGREKVPYSDRPGVLSLQYAFSANNNPLIFGPSLNVNAPTGKTMVCSEVFSEGKFCAACHYGKFSDTLIYNAYGEWLSSDYSKKLANVEGVEGKENKNYRSCQDCHMLSAEIVENTPIARREACSVSSDAFHDFNHNMMKYDESGIPQMIKDAASLDVETELQAETIKLVVRVKNEKAGHKFPTDSPLRHLILVVEVLDESENLMPLVSGETIPVWGGVGKNVSGMTNFGGLPGKVFGMILSDRDTGVYPTAAYWNPTKIEKDNRLKPAMDPAATDESSYTFSLLSDRDVKIRVRLIYRYAFIDLAEKKSWVRPDIVVVQCEGEAGLSGITQCQ